MQLEKEYVNEKQVLSSLFKSTVLAQTQSGRLLQDFAFGGAGGELTFVAMLQKWISPNPLIPPESSSCASRPVGMKSRV